MKVGFTILGFIAVVGLIVVFLGFYPVLRVNGEWVLYRTLASRLQTVETALAQQGYADLAAAEAAEGGDTMLVALEALIDETLVRQEALRQDIDIQAEAEKRIAEASEGIDVRLRIEESYGVSFEVFRDQILLPAAIVDALREKMGDEALVRYFEEARLSADVRIYVVSYRWEDGALIAKE